MTEMINVLASVKLTVEALCRQNSNLCTADAALKFMINQLTGKKTILAKETKKSLLHRIKQKRRAKLSGLLNYLQNPRRSDENAADELFSIPCQTVIKKQIKILIERLKNTKTLDNEKEEEKEKDERTQTQPSIQLTLKEKLQEEIEKSMTTIKPETQETSDLSTSKKRDESV